jgi:16S rRNA (uracil1498-N3)-methyltransferase
MRIPRFYHPAPHPGQTVALPEEAAYHAGRVLRMKPGQPVELFDGLGFDYECVIIRMDKGSIFVQVGEASASRRESGLAICLAQAISAGEKMDFTLQKAVELGVTAIQPLAAARSVVKLDAARAQKRTQHWQKVVTAACEQSGRAVVPEVQPVQPLLDWLGRAASTGLRLLLSPAASQSLRDLAYEQQPITLLIGPEGGLAPEEIAAAESCGFRPVRLGARVLRTETAALAAIAAMQTLWGDF